MLKTAKIFNNGRSQAIRLPKAFRFEGEEVIISHEAGSVVLTPKTKSWLEVYAKLPDLSDFDIDAPPAFEKREQL